MLLILMQGVNTVKLFRKYKKEQMEEMAAEREQLEAERRQTAEMMKELQALKEQLASKELYDELLFPDVCLRAEGDVFLDDMTPDELSKALGVPVKANPSEASEFIRSVLGI